MERIWSLLGLGTLAISLFTTQAHAHYAVASVSASRIDANARTHFVVAGRGNDLGYLPQWAAAAKARKIAQTYPRDQVLMITTLDGSISARMVENMNLTIIRSVGTVLDANQLMRELAAFNQIASIHVYGHGAITEGVFLDQYGGGHDVRWYPNDPAPAQLVGHFTSDAIVTLNGCNVGHYMAPRLAKLWGIPVSGALTGTHFEGIHSADGAFYELGGGLGESELHSTTSGKSMLAETRCDEACMRMRPDNGAYGGVYARPRHYGQGLGFYKFFCSGISREKCLGGMARSILIDVSTDALLPTPTYEQYAEVVREWMCPSGKVGSSVQRECISALAAIDIRQIRQSNAQRLYTPFEGRSAQCTMATCYPSPVCSSSILGAVRCAMSSPVGPSTTFVDEYMYYLEGYNYLGAPRGA